MRSRNASEAEYLNLSRQVAVLLALMLLIISLTAFTSGGTPHSSTIGTAAPFLVLALMTWYLILVLTYREDIIAGIAAIFFRRGSGNIAKSSIVIALLAYAIATAVFLLAISSLPGIRQIFMINLGEMISTPTEVGPPPPQPLPASEASSLTSPLWYYGIVVFTAIAAVSLVIFLQGARLAFKTRDIHFKDEGHEEIKLREETTGIVRWGVQAIKGPSATQRYHEIIFECYSRMCIALSKAGLVIRPTQTPREFAQEVSAKLRIGKEGVRGLTFLFEEARYSDHTINEDKRIMARKHLESVEQSLTANAGST